MGSLVKSLPFACSILAVICSATAILLVQQKETAVRIDTKQVTASDIVELEESMSLLRSDLRKVQLELAALEPASAAMPPALAQEELEKNPPRLTAADGQVDEMLLAAVDAVMEERGAEYVERAQREAKRRGQRAGYSKLVNRVGDRLPDILRGVAERMSLDPRRRLLVGEILETSQESMSSLLEELDADPPLSDEETQEVTSEIWGTVTGMVAQLGEILEPAEMVELGEIVQEAEIPKIGHVIRQAGAEEMAEQEHAEAGSGS